MKSDVSLRRIDPREAPVVGELIRDTMRASYPAVYPPRGTGRASRRSARSAAIRSYPVDISSFYRGFVAS